MLYPTICPKCSHHWEDRHLCVICPNCNHKFIAPSNIMTSKKYKGNIKCSDKDIRLMKDSEFKPVKDAIKDGTIQSGCVGEI